MPVCWGENENRKVSFVFQILKIPEEEEESLKHLKTHRTSVTVYVAFLLLLSSQVGAFRLTRLALTGLDAGRRLPPASLHQRDALTEMEEGSPDVKASRSRSIDQKPSFRGPTWPFGVHRPCWESRYNRLVVYFDEVFYFHLDYTENRS